MRLYLRDNKRYGIFKANSSIGEIKIEICKYGFGELITITPYKGKIFGLSILSVHTIEDRNEYKETEDKILLYGISVNKPFTRCLKRYK